MSDYKRFISYLYCYDNGIKKNNIGFARVETRNNQCKITIHIKLLSLSNTTLETYLFYRKNNRILGLPLCPLEVKNSVGDCQIVIPATNILNSKLPFSIIGGIIITVSQSRLLGTEWDDLPIIPSIFEIEETETICAADVEPQTGKETVAKETEVKKISETETLPETKPEALKRPEAVQAKPTQTKSIQTEPVQIKPSQVKTTQTESAQIKPSQAKPTQTEALETTPSVPPETENKVIPNPVPKDNTIQEKEAAVQPDFLDTITNYLLIDPAYIDHLDIDYAGLRQNSFLLHGYSSYRHLILAKWLVSSQLSAAEVDSENSPLEIHDFDIFYQIGVPGIYSDRERAIAEKFGFAEFKTTKGTPVKHGDFGYWLTTVSF